MNGKWIEIFRAGKQTDSAGNTKEWTEADLDQIVAKYNGQKDHEAPVVVGHPESNSPSFGWVESLKRDGKILFAKMKEVLPAFEEMVKQGTYKKRSISLYPDLTLRHIGFLGGMPPAIKGLADIAFREGEQPTTYEFADLDDMTVARLFRRLRDFIIGQFGQATADQVIPDYEVTAMQVAASMPDDDEQGIQPAYSEKESDMTKEEVKALIGDALKGQQQAFSEELKTMGERNKALETELAGLRKQIGDKDEATLRRELTAFCEGLPTRIAPAQIPAIVGHMMALRTAEPLEFDDGKGGKLKKPQLDCYQEDLKKLPETIQLGEFASGTNAGERQVEMDALALSRKAQEFQDSEAKAGRTVTIADAVFHVRQEARKGGAN